jgi:hypothetical protein
MSAPVTGSRKLLLLAALLLTCFTFFPQETQAAEAAQTTQVAECVAIPAATGRNAVRLSVSLNQEQLICCVIPH